MFKYKGNILFIVMFMLLLSSLIGLLIVNYVRQIFASSSLFYDYYQSYYLANAGIELGLVKVKNRGYGFEDGVGSGSQLNHIRTCTSKMCQTNYHIQASHTVLIDHTSQPENCNTDGRYIKTSGQNLIVPLFTDKQSTQEQGIFGHTYQNLTTQEISSIKLSLSGSSLKYAVALLVIDPDGEFVDSSVGIFDQATFVLSSLTNTGSLYGESILSKLTHNNQGFLVLSNLSDHNVSLCLQSKQKLPSSSVLISSQGQYNKLIVSLKANKKVAIPDDYAYAAIGGVGDE